MYNQVNQRISLFFVFFRVAVLFFLWRGGLILTAFIGLNLSQEYSGSYNHDSEWNYFSDHYLLNGFYRWDSDWYDYIAREGYGTQEGRRAYATAFFPLFPFLARWLGLLVGDRLTAGLFLSYLSLFFGLFYCYRIGLKFLDRITVERSIILLLVFPGSFFFSAFYTESLFLFLTSGSFFYFLSRRFFWAGIFGLLACLTRPTGITLIAVMMASLIFQWFSGQRKPKWSVLFLLLIPVGLFIYMILLFFWTGNPLAFVNAQSHWSRSNTFPLLTLLQAWYSIDFSFPRDMTNIQFAINWFCAVGFLILGIVMLVSAWKEKTDIGLPLWVLAGVLMPLSTGSVDSMVRYCSVLFPGFFSIATHIKSDIFYFWLITFWSSLLVVYSLGFMNKFWVV